MINKLKYDELKDNYSGKIKLLDNTCKLTVNSGKSVIDNYEKFIENIDMVDDILKNTIVEQLFDSALNYFNVLDSTMKFDKKIMKDLLQINSLNFLEDYVEVFYIGGDNIFSNNMILILVDYQGNILSDADLLS